MYVWYEGNEDLSSGVYSKLEFACTRLLTTRIGVLGGVRERGFFYGWYRLDSFFFPTLDPCRFCPEGKSGLLVGKGRKERGLALFCKNYRL